MKLQKVILRPLITEKTTSLTAQNKYSFAVGLTSSKNAISKAVEDTFKVDVLKVRTSIVPGKEKRSVNKKNNYRQPKWKKAIVTLKDGQKIDLFERGEDK